MRYTGIQPHYFPRLHYIARLLNTDIFVLRDEVQYVKKHKFPDGKNGSSYQSHAPIATNDGVFLLNVPVKKGKRPIRESEISYNYPWIKIHLETIKQHYIKSPQFDVLFPFVTLLLERKYATLADLNIATLMWALSILLEISDMPDPFYNIDTFTATLTNINHPFRIKKIMKGSAIPVLNNPIGTMTASEKILAVCKELGITEDYCGGTAIVAYFDQELFQSHGMRITVQDWTCAPYQQPYIRKTGFLANMSVLDLLMNVPPAQARKVVSSTD
jgi:hypothetical protein